MVSTFVELFVKKRQKKILIIKISSICAIIFLFLLIVLHFVNIFLLKYALKQLIDDYTHNSNINVSYVLKSDWLKSKIYVHDFKFYDISGSNELVIEKMQIAQDKGIFTPSVVNVQMSDVNLKFRDKQLKIVQYGNQLGTYIHINKHFFKKPTFGGTEIKSNVKYVIYHQNVEIGEINLDRFKYLDDDANAIMEYKGNILMHSNEFIRYTFLLDTPIKWEIKMFKNTEQGTEGLESNKKVEINNVRLEKFDLDLDFAKLSTTGNLSYGTRLQQINFDLFIENQRKFIDAIFNIALQNNNDTFKKWKKLHNYMVYQLVPKLQFNNKIIGKRDLLLKIEKTNYMPEITLNGIGINDIAKEMSKAMK